MKSKYSTYLFLLAFILGGIIYSCKKKLSVENKNDLVSKAANHAKMEELGKALFFDTNLSDPPGQSCAVCHAPEVGFTGPHMEINLRGTVYEGAFPGRFGDRKPPASAYLGDCPVLHKEKDGSWVGGMFWDGRATGWELGDPLAEQAKGPYLNPMEQNLPDARSVITIVKASAYAGLFEEVFGIGSLDKPDAYDNVGRAIAAYERSAESSPFTSKYDYWLKGKAKMSAIERRGKALFRGKGKCDLCHLIKGNQPVLTDFSYDNLGIPKNPDNPYTVSHPDWADPGIGGFLKSIGNDTWAENIGKHKVPTLRNVDLRPYPEFVKAFGHNGYFKSLEEIVHFYNTRDIPGEGWNGKPWPAPEVTENMNTEELGNLKLSAKEEAAIVAFLKILSDGYKP